MRPCRRSAARRRKEALSGAGNRIGVGLIVEAQQALQKQHIAVRLVSMPCWELFEAQSCDYRDSMLLQSVHVRLAVEAGVTQGWHRYVGDQEDVIGVGPFWRVGSRAGSHARIWLQC